MALRAPLAHAVTARWPAMGGPLRLRLPVAVTLTFQPLPRLLGRAMSSVARPICLVSVSAGARLTRLARKCRARLFREFVAWILNPHALALLVFWPGWWLLAAVWAVWRVLG
jgi:hypothetical protein